MAGLWVDIYDVTGMTKQEPGPIYTVQEWQNSPALDEAGVCEFTMPVGDPRANMLQELRQAWCYTVENEVVTLVGAMIIARITFIKGKDGSPSLLRVTGSDILYELSYRDTGSELLIKELGWAFLNNPDDPDKPKGRVHELHLHSGTYTDKDLDHTYDGDATTTYDELKLEMAYEGSAYRYTYVGKDSRYDRIYVQVRTPNINAVTLKVQYNSSDGWKDLTVTDGTESGGKTFAQSGEISFTRPTDWERCTPTEAAGSWFWLRLYATGDTSDIEVYEFTVYGDVATADGINLIMALAPAGWSVGTYTTTAKTAYLEFRNVSVLAALRALAEATGEHFRLGSGKVVEWLRDTNPDAPVYVIASGTDAVENNPYAALALDLEEERDAYELITRVIPYGGGMASGRVTLADCTKTPEAGYTLDKVKNYIKCDAGEASYPRIERSVSFPNIVLQQPDSYQDHPEMASDALYEAALTHLKDHKEPQYAYRVTLAKNALAIKVGEAVWLDYQEYAEDGTCTKNIAREVYVLRTTRGYDGAGFFTCELEVATVKKRPKTDGEQVAMLAGAIMDLTAHGSLAVQTVVRQITSDDVDINGGSIDGTPIGASIASTGRFTTVEILSTLTLPAQAANALFAGPAAGGAAVPAFRAMVPADLPLETAIIWGATHEWTQVAADSYALKTKVSGQTYARWGIMGDGKQEWGSGDAARDTNLYRGAANQLKTDDALHVVGNITTDGTVDGVDIAGFAAAQFLTLAVNASISNERVFTPGDGLAGTDGGAGSTYTLAVGIDTAAGLKFDASTPKKTQVNLGSGLTFSTGAIVPGWATPAIILGLNASAGDATGIIRSNATIAAFDATVPSTIQPDDAAATGSAAFAARRDHVHAIVAAAPGAIQPDDPADEGSAYSFARSDHRHSIVAAAPGLIYPSASASEGDATSFARSNHVHSAAAAAPAADSVGVSASAQGDATSFARSNHYHNIDEGMAPTWTGTHKFDHASAGISATNALKITAGSYVDFSPPSGVRMSATNMPWIKSEHFASQTTGWGISYAGYADFRYLYADELHAKVFVADLEQALAGGQIISKSVAILALDFTAPAAGAAATLTVEDLPSAQDMRVFESGDFVCVRSFSRKEGGLDISNCWGVVTNYADDPGGVEYTQSWTFTRSAAPNAGAMAASTVVAAKSLALDYGTSGNGYWEVSAVDTSIDGVDAGTWAGVTPYAQIVTWTTHPNSGKVVRSRLGQLNGIFTSGDEYGLYAGSGVTDASQYLRISNLGFDLHNLDLKMYVGAVPVVAMLYGAGSPSIALGAALPTAPLTGSGIWMGKDGADYEFRVGNIDTGVLTAGLHWDGAALNIVGGLMTGPGASYVANGVTLYCPFDGNQPYSLYQDINPNGHLGQTATQNAGLGLSTGWYGRYGKALLTAPSRTNHITNPSFEVDTAGWTAAYGTVARVTSEGYVGSCCAQVTNDEGSNGYIYQTKTTSTGGTWVAQCYLKAATAADVGLNFSLLLRIHYTDATQDDVQTGCTMTANWQHRLVLQAANGGKTVDWVRVYIVSIDTPTRSCYVDAVQLENATFGGPYLDGTMPGCTWSGTAHGSTSARADAHYLTYPLPGIMNTPAREGTVAMWVYLVNANTSGGFLWSAGNAASELDGYITSGGNVVFRVDTTSKTSATITERVWHHIVFIWNATKHWMVIDGTATTQATHVNIPDLGPTFGVSPSPSYGHPGYIDDLLVFNRALTTQEAQQLYYSNGPAVVGTNKFELKLTRGHGQAYVLAHGGGIFGYDASFANAFSLLTEAATIGGEALAAGDVLIGSNAWDKVNLLWDQSAGTLSLRQGTTGVVRLTSSVVEIGTDLAFLRATVDGDLDFYSTVQSLTVLRAHFDHAGSGYLADGKIAWTTAGILNVSGWTLEDGKLSSTGIHLRSGASAALAFGATPPASASSGTGIFLDRTGLYGLKANVKQAYLDGVTGAVLAGAGKTWMDVDGLSIEAGIAYVAGAAVKIRLPIAGSDIGKLWGHVPQSPNIFDGVYLEAEEQSGYGARLMLRAVSTGAGHISKVTMMAMAASGDSPYILITDDPAGVGAIDVAGGVLTAWDTLNAKLGLNVGTATGAATGDIRASGNLSVTGRAVVLSNAFAYSDDAVKDFLAVTLPASAMIYLEVTIITHRSTGTGLYGGEKKYRVFIYRDSAGTERANSTVELTDFGYTGEITADSLTNARSTDTYTFTIRRDHTASPGVVMSILVTGLQYGCSGIAML